MHLTDDMIHHIGFLARIRITEEEIQRVQDKLDHILDWVEQLGALDTNNVAPITNIHEKALPMTRSDTVSEGRMPDKIVANSPDVIDNFFAVPKVVE